LLKGFYVADREELEADEEEMESQIYADRVDFGRVKDIMNAQEKMQNKKGKKLFSKIKKQMK